MDLLEENINVGKTLGTIWKMLFFEIVEHFGKLEQISENPKIGKSYVFFTTCVNKSKQFKKQRTT